MPQLFRGNFDFEHELATGYSSPLPQNLRAVNARFAIRLLSLTKPGDALWLPELDILSQQDQLALAQQCRLKKTHLIFSIDELPPGVDWKLSPWGWTESLRQIVEERQWEQSIPNQEAVLWLNSRATSFTSEQTVKVLSAKFLAIDSEAVLMEHLESIISPSEAWVIKAEYGMSARERILGQGTAISSGHRGWIQKRLGSGQRLFFEPWLHSLEEMSFHFEIDVNGGVHYLGQTLLLTDLQGRYLGNRTVSFSESDTLDGEWSETFKIQNEFVQTAASRGYFGPLSIDAMRYQDSDGQIKFRPLQDVNGRYTMGRCELEASRSCGSLDQ